MASLDGSKTISMEVDATTADASAPPQVANQESATTSLPSSSDATQMSSSSDGNSAPNNTASTLDMINQSSLPVSFPAMSDFNTSASMLGKGLEEYMNDAKGMQFNSFKRFFGNESHSSDSMSELKDMILDGPDGRFYTPLAMRHTHSTPLKKAPSILDEYATRAGLPPPIPLDPFQRSCSTPSAFRTRSVNSAFGSVRSASPANTEETSSLVGVQYVSMSDEPAVSYRCSAFDPVQYYARQLEDMAVQEDMERTVIEVTDTMTSLVEIDNPKSPSKRRPKRGAAVAERFLSNVRGFRRRRRGRSARPDSFRSSSSSQGMATTDGEEEEDDDESVMSMPPQTTVTIITESGSATTASRNSELSAILTQSSSLSSARNVLGDRPSDQEEPLRPAAPTYHHLDSDLEEDGQYQKIEASLHAESPTSVPSPTYQAMVDERAQQGVQGNQIRIQVSGKRTPPTSAGFGAKENTSPVPFNSPSPQRVSRSLDSALTQRSNDSVTDSPQTNRSSNTGSSMGHTTQATSCSSIQQSNLSTISETDREVMLANKEGKRRRGLDRLRMHAKEGINTGGTESVNSSSTNSNSTSTNPHGYLALQGSPSPREGANVAMDRFFMNGGTTPALPNHRVHSLGNSSSSRRSGRSSSPITDGSSAMTHTSSSSSSRTEPPTFVSYLDSKKASDLTTREEMETCDSRSGGVDKEEREGSPAPIVEYQPMDFEEAALAQQVPKPVRPPSRPDKFRSRPPRSPMKGSRMITTPPPCRTPPLYQQLSPPRQIVDEPHQNISQPYVLRTTLSGKNLVLVGEVGTNGQDDELGLEVMHGVTYEEHAIEIMKANSTDDMVPM